eukprot:COSAG01_NODE_804_length_13444_cov_6.162683_8_plen_237_part_00
MAPIFRIYWLLSQRPLTLGVGNRPRQRNILLCGSIKMYNPSRSMYCYPISLSRNLTMFNLYSKCRSIQLVLPLLFICISSPAALCEEPLVVFLVRHAEKVDNSQNPPLSAAGKVRAKTLASVLQDAKIQTIHSTDYLRTKKTAAPIADKLGLKTQLYDADELPDFVQNLKGQGGRHLVVGHSNTTPKLVELLGGDPGTIINDKEYDRLYILNLRKSGETNTILIRFGKPSETATRN